LRELVPKADLIGVLVDPTSPSNGRNCRNPHANPEQRLPLVDARTEADFDGRVTGPFRRIDQVVN
jgi:hypothetical protein